MDSLEFHGIIISQRQLTALQTDITDSNNSAAKMNKRALTLFRGTAMVSL